MLVTVDDSGRATKIAGNPEHPVTQGFLCSKVNRYLERTYHSERLLYPQIRVGAKGEGKFRRATWDEALQLIGDRFQEIIDSPDGPQAILPYSYAGTMGVIQGSSMDRRFFHLIGASLLDRTICATAGGDAMNFTYGTRMGTDTEDVGEAKLIILWGTNTLTSNPHLWPFVRKAHDNGAKIICIDPLRTRTAAASDEHIAIRPGTDAALALAMMHVLFRDNLYDREYLERMTIGWEALRDRALAGYSPQKAAKICRISVETIESLAHRYGTTRPTFIRLNYGLQRHAGGGNAVRAVSLLPAVTGAWNDVGGGCQLSTSGAFALNAAAVERPDLIRPGTRTINMSRLGEALTETDNPPVKALLVYNSNPGSVAPDRNKVIRGLRRQDLFTVVLEHFQTDTADYADVLLPATTQLEHDDLHKAYGHLYLMYNHRAIEPLGEALPNSEIFRRLAAKMRIDHDAVRDSDEAMMRQALGDSAGTATIGRPAVPFDEDGQPWVTASAEDDVAAPITPANPGLDDLRERGSMRVSVGAPHLPFRHGATLRTASGRIEIISPRVAALGLDPLPDYVPPLESEERNPELVARFPLALISPPAHTFLNSTFVNVTSLRRAAGKPTLDIHAGDAERRGIRNGDVVSIFNDRGTFTAEAVITDRVQPGVVSAPSVWWGRLTDDGANANQTTSEALTDLGRGATFYDNMVNVRPMQPATLHTTK